MSDRLEAGLARPRPRSGVFGAIEAIELVEDDLGRRIWPQLQAHWPLIDFHGLRDAFVIRYAPGEQESLRRHHDVAQVSASVRLDDDHDGAELPLAGMA